MKIRQRLTVLAAAALIILGGLGLSGCSKSTKADNKTQTITVGTSGAPKPFTYVNSHQKLVGYDIDTVRAIAKEIPGLKVNFQKTEIPSILAGLDSGRFQVGANNFASNPQRREKYYYSKPTFKDQYVIVVKKNNHTIKSFDDIAGKTTISAPGVNFTTAVETFNKKAKVKSKITYSNEDPAKTLQDVQDGKYDYVLIDKPLYQNYQKTYHLSGIKAVNLTQLDSKQISASTPYSYLLVEKTPEGKKLLKKINAAITKIQANGTAKKISETYFYGDYTPKEGD
ncbi:transporter substrate-binding domain-containing protein [Secundilactobacillus kimchicus]|uniref:Amino acid ABC transporter substrate-binding protein n=1 Tax=Secundilactobacillus kimchicus JCM 15530 TaxID=1302272 RepID=A0A0R1HUY3_9LACO|nr:transporter substrate-binding domain-containing protein [Secundilactobacillus kimchicus]KRK47281.1 amino acid ABC transporter substrate-binding protein [Secundilactobacillus kimchicus JCM 15530]MBT9672383.1 transporter substrate-binding domain-containing protein [Secundilactobacillus kimchicus]